MVVRSEAQPRLATLAAKIRAANNSAERALDIGRWLAEAKADESIPRGEWEHWIAREAGLPYSAAYRYLKLFRAAERARSR